MVLWLPCWLTHWFVIHFSLEILEGILVREAEVLNMLWLGLISVILLIGHEIVDKGWLCTWSCDSIEDRASPCVHVRHFWLLEAHFVSDTHLMALIHQLKAGVHSI